MLGLEDTLCLLEYFIVLADELPAVLQFGEIPEVLSREVFEEVEIFLGLMVEDAVCP